MRIISESFIFVTSIVKAILWVLILLTAFGLALPYIGNVSKFDYLQPIINYEQQLNSAVKTYVPTQINNQDRSRMITIIGLWILAILTSRIKNTMSSKLERGRVQDELNIIKTQGITDEQKKSIEQFQERVDESSFKGKNRQQLLKDFISLKKELEKTGRNLAFLAIDVVDSTGMKQGEEPAVVENDFHLYHDFVISKFKEHGYIKAAWTPDGVMACFNTTEQAIDAAQSIIDGLKNFNESIKTMKRDFMIRCGINTGFVYYDLSTPLEEFSDRVIDIAGHMQKHAPVNTILIAKEIIKPIKTYEDFDPGKKIVDGLEVYEWHPKKDMDAAA